MLAFACAETLVYVAFRVVCVELRVVLSVSVDAIAWPADNPESSLNQFDLVKYQQ